MDIYNEYVQDFERNNCGRDFLLDKENDAFKIQLTYQLDFCNGRGGKADEFKGVESILDYKGRRVYVRSDVYTRDYLNVTHLKEALAGHENCKVYGRIKLSSMTKLPTGTILMDDVIVPSSLKKFPKTIQYTGRLIDETTGKELTVDEINNRDHIALSEAKQSGIIAHPDNLGNPIKIGDFCLRFSIKKEYNTKAKVELEPVLVKGCNSSKVIVENIFGIPMNVFGYELVGYNQAETLYMTKRTLNELKK